MADVARVTKRLEIHLSAKLCDLAEKQIQVVGDRWINQHEADPYIWNYETCYISTRQDESWVIVYTQ
jgi:hypothetical protein